jgi:hypothetical protein
MSPQNLPGIDSAQAYLGMTLGQIAQAVGTDELRLDQWRSGAVPSPIFMARLAALVAEMRITFSNREAAQEWLHRPLLTSERRSPLDLILDGKAEELTGMLYALNSGVST